MDLDRFLKAQNNMYHVALSEIKGGYKQSHWIWYIFPQLKGLGFSSNAEYYGIKDAKEAKAYYEHPILSQRLKEISHALLMLDSSDPSEVIVEPHFISGKNKEKLQNKKANGWRVMPYSTA